MNLNNISNIANQINWTKTFDFNIEINPKDLNFANLIQWGDNNQMNDIIATCAKNINLPQYTGNFEETLIAGTWHFARVTNPVLQLEITFRDFNDGALYRKFLNAYFMGPDNYSDKTAFIITIKLNDTVILNTDSAQLSDVSQLSLSHDNAEILEFNVSFKMNFPMTELFSNLSNIELSKSVNNTSQTGIVNTAKNIFSNVIKNGLSTAQNSIINNYKKMVNDW